MGNEPARELKQHWPRALADEFNRILNSSANVRGLFLVVADRLHAGLIYAFKRRGSRVLLAREF